jgi:two-component system sensor histidine kinase FlrB
VADGDFSRRIAIRRNDELGLLIRSFDRMTERLEGNYQALNALNRQLERKIRELTRTRRRLSQKQRLALVGEAISKTSHEIQNKIGGIGVWVQNLERSSAGDETTALCIRELKAALHSSQDLLVHCKQFYRRPPLNMGEIPAQDLINTCLIRIAPEVQLKCLHVETDFGDDTLTIEMDALQMTDALVNIFLNAVYFSPEGGTLSVGVVRDGRYVVFSVSDRGPGLQAKDKLFRPFYTTKPSGSGLGLAITRNIVDAHSGRIRACNRPGGGACFEIRLPTRKQA